MSVKSQNYIFMNIDVKGIPFFKLFSYIGNFDFGASKFYEIEAIINLLSEVSIQELLISDEINLDRGDGGSDITLYYEKFDGNLYEIHSRFGGDICGFALFLDIKLVDDGENKIEIINKSYNFTSCETGSPISYLDFLKIGEDGDLDDKQIKELEIQKKRVESEYGLVENPIPISYQTLPCPLCGNLGCDLLVYGGLEEIDIKEKKKLFGETYPDVFEYYLRTGYVPAHSNCSEIPTEE